MGGERILVVDDNDSNLRLLQYLLESEGYSVSMAVDAASALDMVRREPPAVILLDLQLPDMDGCELTRRLKANPETRSISIFAVTARAMRGDEARAVEAGCDGYFSKPIDTRTLPQAIAEHLASRRP